MKISKRIISFMLVVMLLCQMSVVDVLAAETDGADSSDKVTILFTHDIHSRLEEYKDTDGSIVGGFSRLKTAIDAKKAENSKTFLFDGGDFSMGTLYQTVFETEASELTMLGRLGVEATTFGNHEFDYRSQGVDSMFHAAIQNAEDDPSLVLPQFLTCNIDWEKNKSEDNKLVQKALEDYGSTDYTIIEHDGVRVGVYGLMGEDSAACAPESGIEFDGIVESSKRVVEELKKEDVDMIVCLSHSGTNPDSKKSEDEILAKEVPDIDVIVSAHTHTTLEEPIIVGDTVIASAGCYGKNLGEIDLVPSEDGRWELADYTLELMDESVAKDAEIEAYLEDYREAIDEEYLAQFGYTMDQVLAKNDYDFTPIAEIEKTLHDDNLGSLISDSYIYAIKEAEGDDYIPVDLAVVPTGVIRDSFAKGDITVSDAFNVSALGIGADRITGYPLVSVYLTGAELKTVAEIDVSVSSLMTTAQLFPSGMKWVYNPHRLILNRVTEVGLTPDMVGVEDAMVQDQMIPLEDDKLYRVAAGLYSAQMLGAVESTSMGILKVTPKNAEGEVIEDFEEYIIHDAQGNEVKEWYALASYLDSFSENEDGVSVVPARYAQAEERKVCQDSANIIDILKNPNKIAKVVYLIIVAVILLLVLIIWLIVKLIKKIKNRKKAK